MVQYYDSGPKVANAVNVHILIRIVSCVSLFLVFFVWNAIIYLLKLNICLIHLSAK